MQKKHKVDRIKKTAGEAELDVRLKEFWRQNNHFADLINAVVFHGRQRITPEMLVEQDTDISGAVSFPEYEETLSITAFTTKRCEPCLKGQGRYCEGIWISFQKSITNQFRQRRRS